MARTCGHCGLRCGDYDGGWAAVPGPGGESVPVCHPNAAGRPDCYRRVTVYREPLGALRDLAVKPDGISERLGRCGDPITVVPPRVFAELLDWIAAQDEPVPALMRAVERLRFRAETMGEWARADEPD